MVVASKPPVSLFSRNNLPDSSSGMMTLKFFNPFSCHDLIRFQRGESILRMMEDWQRELPVK